MSIDYLNIFLSFFMITLPLMCFSFYDLSFHLARVYFLSFCFLFQRFRRLFVDWFLCFISFGSLIMLLHNFIVFNFHLLCFDELFRDFYSCSNKAFPCKRTTGAFMVIETFCVETRKSLTRLVPFRCFSLFSLTLLLLHLLIIESEWGFLTFLDKIISSVGNRNKSLTKNVSNSQWVLKIFTFFYSISSRDH
jgi:hypothetical protein